MLADMFEPALIEQDSETERTCGNCLHRKSFEHFYRDGKNPDGTNKYRRDCKDCYRVTRLKSRRAKRAKPTAAVRPKGGRRRK